MHMNYGRHDNSAQYRNNKQTANNRRVCQRSLNVQPHVSRRRLSAECEFMASDSSDVTVDTQRTFVEESLHGRRPLVENVANSGWHGQGRGRQQGQVNVGSPDGAVFPSALAVQHPLVVDFQRPLVPLEPFVNFKWCSI